MKTCEKCNFEFDDFEKSCPKCSEKADNTEIMDKEKWKPLTRVRDDIEFEMVKDVLGMADIPVIRNVKGIDGFAQIILGVPIAGIEVLVPEDRYEEATQLLEAPLEEEFKEE